MPTPSNPSKAPPTVQLRFILQDPASLGQERREITVLASKGASVLETALEHGIHIEHACGGVCACSTCHVYLKEGEGQVNEPDDKELDRVDEAPGAQLNSRLSCQTIIQGDGPITVEVPAWNRNAVKEVPH